MDERTEDDGEDAGGSGVDHRPIVTARLVLRPPDLEDTPYLVELANNRRIAEQTSRMPHPFTASDAREWVARCNAPTSHGPSLAYVVILREGQTLVGCTGYGACAEHEAEIGYWIGEPFWGRGIATEAVQAAIDRAFRDSHLQRLIGRCRVANKASRRVLEKCGFQYTGTGMCRSRALNSSVPSEDFVLERSVWHSLKRWGAT